MMMANQNLIATIVVGLGLAFVFGALARRLRIPLLPPFLPIAHQSRDAACV
jgi:predicted Kef-type K+ transport protein